MITNIKRSENEVIIEFDNRPEFRIVTDNGAAWHLAEQLLSPHAKLTYSEYLSVSEMEDEDTLKVA